MALWPNQYKEPGSSQPDARGALSIPLSVVKELAMAYQAKELPTETDQRNGDIEIVKLDVAAWKNDPGDNPKRPVIKCEVKSWPEMKERQAARDAKNAASSGGGSDAATGWGIDF